MNTSFPPLTFSIVATLALGGASLTAAEEERMPPEHVTFFEQKIRPVMVQHCYKCHSQKEDKDKGGLTMDSRSALRAGGSSGYVVLPGDPSNSLLLKAMKFQIQ